ncbi:molybdopterin-dependent oxidoreductase [Microbacterium esteraromaticum]|uniref:molybdopterin-dependent oxidoreductase n=1 Tax=Microbacterium esteraromaticum TaxID=57043 RepID=UPI001F5C0F07|nr:molybdopterin-dependent oxidoreductase [Microbacterium esteraromaticum]
MTDERVSRRRFLTGVAAGSAAMGALALTHSVLPWGPFSLADERRRLDAPQRVPVNRTAAQAGAVALASDPDWRLTLRNGARTAVLSAQELAGLPQRTETLPIACVEGWTAVADWSGVRLAELMMLVGAGPGDDLRLRSLQQRGAFSVTTMPAVYAQDPLTLIALRLNGERLSLDHGYPARVIAPGRPGVLQTKWLHTIEVL